jgi:hypothetical protein
MSTIESITYVDAVTPTQSDTTADPAGPFAAFMVRATGDVKITTTGGHNTVIPACQAGTIYPIAHTRVWSTGTVSTDIVCFSSNPYRPAMNPGAGVVLP